MILDDLRHIVCDLHQALPKNGLCTWTSGNLSGRDPESGHIVIKPSGVFFEDLLPENMVVVNQNADVLEGDFKPSSDTATHCYIYRAMPEVGGIVHTHSPYATAWAALGRDIPCVLTAMADEFGGVIPCGGFALIGGEEIGREVVRVLREGPNQNSPAVIMQNHGVFAIGTTPVAAIKAAVMCEDVARTVFFAHQLGNPIPISDENIAKLHRRYTTVYGQ
jgi:L-ribulose-5-phosphate 4-epimerase